MLAPSKDDLRPQSQGGVSLWYIATRAGVSHRSDQWILNYVRQLIDQERFPRPLPSFTLGGKRRLGVTFHSRWLRTAVDAWFEAFMPSHLVDVAEDAQLRRDAELLDARADELAPRKAAGGSR